MNKQHFKRLLHEVPSFKRFLTLKEIQTLTDETCENTLIEKITIGHTIENKPLNMYAMGKGKKTAMIIGVPHSDEPLGSLVTTYFMKWMIANIEAEFFNWRWLIIPVLEQRGMRMNEGWFSNLNSLEDMAKYTFRESTEDQCEWSFPFTYKNYEWSHSRPEAQAVKETLKAEKPNLLCSLHHSGFYETYYYFSRDLPEAYPKLTELASDLQLSLSHAAPDVPFGKMLTSGFYKMYGLRDYFDYYSQKQPEGVSSLRRGACSDEWYQENIGGFSFNCEVPLFKSTAKKDNNRSDRKLKNLLQKRKNKERGIIQYCIKGLAKLEPYFNVADPVLLNSLMKHLSNAILFLEHDELQKQYASDRHATNFEIFNNDIMIDVTNLLLLGQVWRVAETIHHKTKVKQLARLIVDLEEKIKFLVDRSKARGEFEALPLQKLIQMQLGSILIIADVLSNSM
jgi:hypothetical protein